MKRQVIATEGAPAAVGPYSQAIRIGNLVFTAGQIGIDPQAKKLVDGGIEAQTRQTLSNLKEILEAAGTSMANVVKVTVYLRDIQDFKAMNQIYAEFFPAAPPARAAAQVAALPLGAAVMIDTVAAIVE